MIKSAWSWSWSFIKDAITEPELMKALLLIGSSGVLFISGDLKCFLGTLALGLGLLNLYEYLRWR
tara:strand:- start:104 stop:298 length:195 start_codon:yes stop_codon:yes gene_type:complete